MAMIFKSSLYVIYTGYFRPYELPFANNLDLINETFTLVGCYSLVMFSEFVPDAHTRYLCGWYLVSLTFLMIGINLCIIFFDTIKMTCRKCKLKYVRRKKLQALKQQRLDDAKRERLRQLALEATRNDQFFNLGGFGQLNQSEDYLS